MKIKKKGFFDLIPGAGGGGGCWDTISIAIKIIFIILNQLMILRFHLISIINALFKCIPGAGGGGGGSSKIKIKMKKILIIRLIEIIVSSSVNCSLDK